VDVKTANDPGNLFRVNQNIRPDESRAPLVSKAS
jgi:hypothetical protein